MEDATDPLRRLRWQCRRGMKEMDALLLRFLEIDYAASSTALRSGFEQLLACEDDVLWRWLSGRLECPEPALRDVIRVIHARTAH